MSFIKYLMANHRKNIISFLIIVFISLSAFFGLYGRIIKDYYNLQEWKIIQESCRKENLRTHKLTRGCSLMGSPRSVRLEEIPLVWIIYLLIILGVIPIPYINDRYKEFKTKSASLNTNNE